MARCLFHKYTTNSPGFPWERHAPAWLLEPGWSPAFPGGGTGEGLTKWTSSGTFRDNKQHLQSLRHNSPSGGTAMQSLLWPEVPGLFTSNFGVAARPTTLLQPIKLSSSLS